jgi:NAD(P)-dependent dehydrogenase (short-subunit alcohol dehydrogenase family)
VCERCHRQGGVVDYLALSFNTALAFSPTDVAAVRVWAKSLMILGSLISLSLAALVIARAVNILRPPLAQQECSSLPIVALPGYKEGMELLEARALVFGGTSGIGLATTQQLAAAGADVTAVSRSPNRSPLPDGVTSLACDVLDRDQVARLFDDVGTFDILVNTAVAGDRAFGPFLEMDMDGFQGCFGKVWGYANVVRYGAPQLTPRGSIVLVSGAPARKIRPGQVGIGAAGAAVESLVRSVAQEIAPRRINVVSPGTIDTPMFGDDAEQRSEALTRATEANLIPRAGSADEVAQAILFCLTNDFVTGTTVDVDGGWLLP